MSAVESRALPLVKSFKCLAGDCPHNCCRGWQIPVDEKTKGLYHDMKGLRGRYLRYHLTKFNGNDVIKKILGRCPFMNSDRLCQFEANGEPELMPLVCRIYPREPVRYSELLETTLELSCPAAARLFIENPGRQELIPYDDLEPFFTVGNEDPDFLSFLLSEREKILDFTWDENIPLKKVWKGLYSYISRVMSKIMRNRLSEVYESSEKPEIPEPSDESKNAFFSIRTIDRMILNHIDYGALFMREPVFAKMIGQYNKLFKNMKVATLDRDFDEAVEKMCEENEQLSLKYRSYFSFNIMQLYLKAYEDYHILKPFLFAVLYTELLMLFDLTGYLIDKEITKEKEITTLFLLESCVRHNPFLTDNLLAVMREEFL